MIKPKLPENLINYYYFSGQFAGKIINIEGFNFIVMGLTYEQYHSIQIDKALKY